MVFFCVEFPRSTACFYTVIHEDVRSYEGRICLADLPSPEIFYVFCVAGFLDVQNIALTLSGSGWIPSEFMICPRKFIRMYTDLCSGKTCLLYSVFEGYRHKSHIMLFLCLSMYQHIIHQTCYTSQAV